MARIDLHKLAIVIGFEVVCVDEEYTNYEYMMRLRDIESISYIIKIKNKPDFFEVDEIVSSLIVMLPRKLKRKIKKLMKRKDSDNIDNVIDLLCYTVDEYNSKTKYSLLREYGNVVGVNIEELTDGFILYRVYVIAVEGKRLKAVFRRVAAMDVQRRNLRRIHFICQVG